MDPIFDVLVLVRWLHFGAMFALFGGALFPAYAPGDARGSTWRFSRLSLKIAAPAALVSGVGWLGATIVNMAGPDGAADPDTLRAFFFDTFFGPIEAVRMALLAVVVLLAFVPMRAALRFVLVALASGALLVSQAWLGHAAEGGATAAGVMMIAAYAVHILAGAAWLGGLPPLFARTVAYRRQAAPPGAVLRLLSRFSAMATVAAALAVASGIANAAFRLQGHPGALATTDYGAVLVAKVALVGLMLGFAAYNRFVAMPRLSAADRSEPAASRCVAISIGCEIGIGVAVVLAAAVLGIAPPPVT